MRSSSVLLVVSVVSVAVCGVGGRELDPAACAARFDVQRDKIIRTEESREMGARYLSELDVGSRHECRRLCCETDTCDVFVYEEKSPGSCYLFNCGPPEDFRCKFTAHGNFSSGVLALSRRLAELQDQERLPPPPPPPYRAPAPAPSSTTTTTSPPPPFRPAATSPAPSPALLPSHTTTQPQKAGSRCSRYQWECHTSGECIAVYNACDGVPQCADGSDEAPELGCPAAPPAAPAAVPPPPPPLRTDPPPPPPPPPVLTRPHQPVYPMYEPDGGVGAMSELGAEGGGGGGGGERWPHRLLQAQPRRYPSADVSEGGGGGAGGPRIFSHKGGLVQEEPAFEPPQPQPWPRRPTWPARQDAESGAWGGWGREWADDRRAYPPAPAAGLPPAPALQQEVPAYVPGVGSVGSGATRERTMPELPVLYPAHQSLHDAPKKGPRLPPPPPPPPPQPAPHHAPTDNQPTSPQEQNDSKAHIPSVSSPAQARSRASAGVAGAAGGAGAGAYRADEHDGLSEHPPAAIMLLVIGVCMTGAMGVMVGCRARAARRRLRRGGKPFAHDADYLVNGMYL